MIVKKDMELKHGMMAQNIKVIIKMVKKKDMVNIIGLMEVNMLEIGLIIIKKVMESIFGPIKNAMKDFLKKMFYREKGIINGLMDEISLENLIKEKNKD